MARPWIYRTAIYQVYPRSFCDSNGDGIGDLEGIIRKLGYIRELGFETIWISPFFASPQEDFGYDISDYYTIAPEYGTLEDAERLIAAVHELGMKIVFDMVMNHTSGQHPWFLESKASRDNPKADWYIWRDRPNNWKSITGPHGWHYSKERDQYYYASFLPFQPDLNYRNPDVKKAMFDVCRFWLGKGVDGFRLDIFNCILKDPEFRDNPFSVFHPLPTEEWAGGNFQKRIYSTNWPENEAFAKELRGVIDEFQPERLLLGEVFGGHERIRPYLGENLDGLHLIFLFDILFFRFSAAFFRKKIREYNRHYPPPYMPTIVFSNHDQLRSIRRIGNDLEKAKVLAVLQYTLCGVPTVYYGEEIGMTNGRIPIRIGKDTLAKQYRWVPQWIADRLPIPINRDVCRTPMQWDASANAGFTHKNVSPWLPVNENYPERNVERAQHDPDSLWHIFRQMNTLRREHPALHSGGIETLLPEHAQVLVFRRFTADEELLVCINFSNTKQNPGAVPGFEQVLFSLSGSDRVGRDGLEILPLSACILKK